MSMFKKTPGPVKLFILNEGYNQTRLRRDFAIAGTIAPLAEKLHAQYTGLGLVNAKGKVPTVQQFVESLVSIRNQKSKPGPNGTGVRRKTRGVPVAPPVRPLPVNVTGMDFLQQLPGRVQEALDRVEDGLSIFPELATAFEQARAELIAIRGQLKTSSISVKLTMD